ncbi:MAG: glycosyltransferase family 4 protein [Desertimonas sp.]
MKILLLTQYYAPEVGAAHVRLQAMVRRLVAAGHQVEIVTALPNHPTGAIYPEYRRKLMVTERRDGAVVHRVWVFAAIGSGFKRMLTFASFAVMALLGLARAERPDVVLVESPPLFVALPAMLYRLVRRAPYVMLVADLWPDAAIDLGLLRPGRLSALLYRLEARAYRRALAVCPVTDHQVETLRGVKAVPAEKVFLTPNGVDTELFSPGPADPAHRRLLAPNGEDVVLYAGTHGYAHALDTVIDAAKRLADRRPNVRFVLVGEGSEKARLAARVVDERVTNVAMIDRQPVEEIAAMMRAATIGLATTVRSELFSGARSAKMFPVMASGIPLLYSGVGEGPRIVEAGGAGVVTTPEDAAALADAVEWLLDHPSEAAEMGRRGRQLAVAEYSWDAIVDRFLDELEDRM